MPRNVPSKLLFKAAVGLFTRNMLKRVDLPTPITSIGARYSNKL
jgi:hypothetical protein